MSRSKSTSKSVPREFITPAWVGEDGPSDDVAISTRARLARNVHGSPFPTRAGDADLQRVADLVLDTIRDVGNRVDKLRVLHPARLTEAERLALINTRLVSRQQMDGGRHSPIVLNEAGSLSLMVNEEDHLRIQCILPGFQPMSALQEAERFDNIINSKIEFARTDNYGWLTSSLANIGTGLRLSVMLHLAGLAFLEEDVDVLTAAAQLKISVRGVFGEGTKAFGDIYQVSNETTLGFSTREIASRVRAAAEHLISREREARRKLTAERREEIADLVGQVRSRLSKAGSLSGTDAMAYISMLRLAAVVGLETGLSAREFTRLLIAVQLGFPEGGTLSSDIKRAKLLREMVGSNA